MAFIPVAGDYLQFRVCCYVPTQIALNILHYRVLSTVGGAMDINQAATAFSSLVAIQYKALMSSQASFRGVGCTNLSVPRTREYAGVANAGVGTAGALNSQTQVSWLIRLRGANAGRKSIGHIYPGFPSQTYVTAAGEQTAAGLIVLTNLASQFGPSLVLTSGANALNMEMVIRNKDLTVPVPKTPTGTDVFQLYPAPLWATQRRRGDFGRANPLPF